MNHIKVTKDFKQLSIDFLPFKFYYENIGKL